MFPSSSGILSEATSKPIKTFSIVFFSKLCYTFVTYDGRKSNEQRATSKEQKAASKNFSLSLDDTALKWEFDTFQV